jgi:hypothetical protein
MTIEELESTHLKSPLLVQKESKLHTKISVEFAISILEEIDQKNMDVLGNSLEYYSIYPNIENKIQELKQYLDENT